MSAGLIPADRQERIARLIREQGVVKVTELSQEFGVSVLTIRRDLDVLEGRGLLERSHGGAVLRQNMAVEPLYTQKEQLYRAEKQAIGHEIAKLINDGDTVLINSGSTTLQILYSLRQKKIRVITCNAGAIEAAQNTNIELILTGGRYRQQSNSFVGELGALCLGQIFADKAIIGVDGLSFAHGLTTPVQEEAEITRLMIDRTRGSVICAADHKKIGVVSNFVTAPVDRIDYLVTDEGAKSMINAEELEKAGAKVIFASGN